MANTVSEEPGETGTEDSSSDSSRPMGKKHEDEDSKKVMFCEPLLSSKLTSSVPSRSRNGSRQSKI